jgi:hypothetical protein
VARPRLKATVALVIYQQLVDFSELSGRIDDLRRELGRPPAQDLRPGSGA